MPGHPSFCVYRRSTYLCVMDGFGGYGCPTNAEGSPPLRMQNATVDQRGVLMSHSEQLIGHFQALTAAALAD